MVRLPDGKDPDEVLLAEPDRWRDAGDGFLLRAQAVELAAELKRVEDVAETWVIGGAPREVRVTLDPPALAARGLSAAAVIQQSLSSRPSPACVEVG